MRSEKKTVPESEEKVMTRFTPTPEGMAAARLALGRNLRERRGKRTQAEIAAAVGVNQSLYSRWENGERSPNYQQWRTLATLYGCKMMDLAPRNQYPSLPMDPEERLAAVRARNAAIAHPHRTEEA